MGGLARGLGIGGTLGGGLLGAIPGLGNGGRAAIGPTAPGGVLSPYGGGLVGMMLAKVMARQAGDAAAPNGKKRKKKGTGTVLSPAAAMPTTPGTGY